MKSDIKTCSNRRHSACQARKRTPSRLKPKPIKRLGNYPYLFGGADQALRVPRIVLKGMFGAASTTLWSILP